MPRQSTQPKAYKVYTRGQRRYVEEPPFTGGMHYTDNPLEAGQARLVLNLQPKDFGKRLRPRGGLRATDSFALDITPHETRGQMAFIHHTATSLVEHTTDPDQNFSVRYALAAEARTHHPHRTSTIARTFIGQSKLLIEHAGVKKRSSFLPSPDTPTWDNPAYESDGYVWIYGNNRTSLREMNGMTVDKRVPQGIHASINGNTYLLSNVGLLRLQINYDPASDSFNHNFLKVQPFEVTPMQAVNYGYNALLDNPFSFPNTEGLTMIPQGILPYDRHGNLALKARVGDQVTFKLVYQYELDQEYKVKWEIQSLEGRDLPQVIQKLEDSDTYTNGEEISISHRPTFKRFSMICSIYDPVNLDAPLQVMVLSSYYLSDDDNESGFNLLPPTTVLGNNLMRSTGVTSWNNQMVYWGSHKSVMTIFISDVGDPTYVPYPNHAINFDEVVVECFPYLNDLAVVTEDSIYIVRMEEEGFSKRKVQANIDVSMADRDAIFAIRNMISFKSKNQYNLVVPNPMSLEGELRLAPVSEKVEQILNNFATEIRRILNETYFPALLFDINERDISYTIHDYQCYPTGHDIRYAYKLKISAPQQENRYLDVVLIYNTIFRLWNLEVYQATSMPTTPFMYTADGQIEFISIHHDNDGNAFATWVSPHDEELMDEFPIGRDGVRVFNNRQYLDTGKRDIDGSKKKRLRHVILELNNLASKDIFFNYQVYLDDVARNPMFTYTVERVDDTTLPNYGQIYVEKDLEEPVVVATDYAEEDTAFGITHLDFWSLGNSQFPELTIMKIHLATSGKGYYPRLKWLTRSVDMYEINYVTWAYRDMNVR